jgi:hypothetical protein
MRSNKIPILLAALALIISTLACALTEMSFDNPRMSFDDAGKEITTSYSPDQQFNVVADLNNAPKGTTVEAKWYRVNVSGGDPGPIETEKENVMNIEEETWSGYVSFSLSNADGWKPGEYKAELYLNGELKHTVNFSVK